MDLYEIRDKVKKLHLSNKEGYANYIANKKGDIMKVKNISSFISTDCYCFSCKKIGKKLVEIELII